MSEKFWSGDKPTSDDFIKYIENPPQIRPFIKNIKTDRRAYPIDKDNVFTGNDIIISNFL
ncbi:hypothetical protein HAY21_004709 [Salmonella enterica]|nr:hypothetical protein [Salmonella enterica]